MSIEAIKQMVEALEMVQIDVKTTPNAYEAQRQAIAAGRQAIAEAEKQEPINCRHCGGPDNVLCGGQCKTTAQRQWVGLEDEDVATVKNEFNRGALWAEQVLKEKNT